MIDDEIVNALKEQEPDLRDKYIKRLEKENGKLEGKIADLQSEYVELENFHHNEVNELKEQNIKDCENFNKTMKEIKEQWNKEHFQLTKAKEIMLKLSTCLEGHSNNNFEYELLQEAEQFLKEE